MRAGDVHSCSSGLSSSPLSSCISLGAHSFPMSATNATEHNAAASSNLCHHLKPPSSSSLGAGLGAGLGVGAGALTSTGSGAGAGAGAGSVASAPGTPGAESAAGGAPGGGGVAAPAPSAHTPFTKASIATTCSPTKTDLFIKWL